MPTTCEKSVKGVLLHQDTAPTHRPDFTMTTIDDCDFELTDHHPQLFSGSGTKDLHVFLNLKKHLAGAHFTTDDDVVDAGEVCLNVLDKVPGISEYRFLAPSSKLCQNWLRR